MKQKLQEVEPFLEHNWQLANFERYTIIGPAGVQVSLKPMQSHKFTAPLLLN